MLPQPETPAPHTERRRFPRVDLAVAVDVVGPSGGRWTASTVNLSRSGIQLRCHRAQALAMVEECRGNGRSAEVRQLRLRLTLPSGNAITATARLVYARPMDAQHAVLGLEFTDFEDGSFESLQAYVLECLRF
jgi:c-di-GMP-binding flagellar brake protein YcgR